MSVVMVVVVSVALMAMAARCDGAESAKGSVSVYASDPMWRLLEQQITEAKQEEKWANQQATKVTERIELKKRAGQAYGADRVERERWIQRASAAGKNVAALRLKQLAIEERMGQVPRKAPPVPKNVKR